MKQKIKKQAEIEPNKVIKYSEVIDYFLQSEFISYFITKVIQTPKKQPKLTFVQQLFACLNQKPML